MQQGERSAPGGRASARRRHLIETARALFVRKGFHQTGIAQIAAESQIKIGQIYRDFGSKEAIIAAIVEEDVSAWLEEDVLAAAVAAADADQLRAWIDRFGRPDEKSSECQMMMDGFSESGRNPRVAAIYRSADSAVRTNLVAALTALVSDEGRADDVSLLADLILTMGAGLLVRRIIDPDLSIEPIRRLIRGFIDQTLARSAGSLG